MSVPAEGSYFSRITLKFVEIVAAGVATAVSGYLIAHLGGFLSSPAPAPAASVQAAPSSSTVSSLVRTEPAAPVSADARDQTHEPRPSPAQDANPPAVQPARTTANASRAALARKPMMTGTNAAESKPRDNEDKESVEAEVRAALAKVDASRPPPDMRPHQADIPPASPPAAAQPRPADNRGAAAAVAATPHGADVQPQPALQAPAQQAPLQPAPLPAVEIKSLPVTDVVAAPQPAAPAQDNAGAQGNAPQNAQAEENGVSAAFKKFSDLLHHEPAAPAAEPPRPPMPVGE